MNLLHIDSSILGAGSVSRALSAEIVDRIAKQNDNVVVTYRDLAAAPIPHLSGEYLGALQNSGGGHSPEIEADLAIGAAVLQEFLAADTVVIGVGMYNFGMPTQLKAWIDRVLISGQTFRYTAEGQLEGLAGDKRIILAVARGGYYAAGSPMAAWEHTESHIRTTLGFIGVTNPEVVWADGIAVGPDQRAAGVAAAQAQIAALAA
ncbi:MAG: FMN-dependent NADH-azoreductase [Brevundimonas sp.]